MKVKPEIPAAYRHTNIEVRTPIVADQIQRLVSNLATNPPRPTVPAPGIGPQAQERASKLERGLEALMDRLQRESGKNLWYRLIDQAVETGEGILKLLYRPDRWDNAPERKKEDTDQDYLDRHDAWKRTARLPIVARVVDRLTWYPWYDEDGLARVLEITERPISDLDAQFGAGTGDRCLRNLGLPISETASGFHKVQLIEYWDREWVVYLCMKGIGGPGQVGRHNVIASYKHGYGRVPYFAGIGEETSSNDPNYEAQSSAFAVMYLAPFLDSLYTMWANVGYQTGYPSVVETTGPNPLTTPYEDDSDEEDDPIRMAPGMVYRAPPGGDLRPMNWGPAASAITGMVGEMKGLIQSTLLPSIMQGIPPGSRTAGYAIQELAQAAKSKWITTIANLERAISDAMNFALWLLEEKVQEPLYMLHTFIDKDSGNKQRKYLTLDPKDIKGYYACEVVIKPRNPVDRQQEGTFMMNMHVGGAATLRQVIESYGEEHPDEIMEEMLVEELMQDPDIRNALKQRVLQKSGLAPIVKDIQAAQQLAQGSLMAQSRIAQQGGLAVNTQPGASGLAGGMQKPGAPALPAPQGPGMEVPGMPAAPGMGMALNNPFGAAGQLPRQYRAKPGAKPGFAQARSGGPSIEGFRGGR